MSRIHPHNQGIAQLPELPDDWNYIRLRNLASIHPSSVDKKSSDDEPDVEICNYTDVYYNEIIDGEIEFMEATASASEIEEHSLQEGDILLTKDSESWDDIGVPAYVSEDMESVCGYHLFQVKPDESTVFPKFLYWCMESRGLQFQFERSAKGVTRYGLATHAAADVYIPVPPLQFQMEISKSLDKETAKIAAPQEKLGTEIDILQEKREALITKAVTGQINITGEEEVEQEAPL